MNCTIETLDCDRKSRPFRLRFGSEDGEDYVSEVYTPTKGQRLKSAAYEVCLRYNWLDFPPAAGILADDQLRRLDRLVAEAIHDMDAHPERYVPDPDAFWREMFDWSDGEFHQEMLVYGDPPIPSPDCDRDGEWAAYDYGQESARVIPLTAKKLTANKGEGLEGIEIVEFHSGDCDGNYELEALFCRWQPGVTITKADLDRRRDSLAAKGAAWNKAQAADSDTEEQRELLKAYWAACSECSVTQYLSKNDYSDNWDPEEFRYYAVQLSCYWTLLRYKRYQIWCAINGEDTLGNVTHESETVSATFDVTARVSRGKTVYDSVLVRGDISLEAEALDYMGGHTVAEIKEIMKEFHKGCPIKKKDRWGGLEKGWKPRGVTVASATMRVTVAGWRTLPITPLRIRQVSCKGLEEDTLRMLGQIEKHYPK